MKHTFLLCLAIAALLTSESFAQSPTPAPIPTRELTQFESSLIGKWYTSGDLAKVSYIASAGDMLFTINEVKDTLELYAGDSGTVIAKRHNYETSGVVSGNYILWTNGCWWSRHPVSLSSKAKQR